MTKNIRASLVLFLSVSLSASLAGAGEHSSGMPAAKAFKELRQGNQRFIESRATHPRQDEDRRLELVKGQNPKAIVLSCSDSRVPPEEVFDQGLGEIFVIRVAGNVLGAATVASIEYAVEHLGSNLIVVMGHESCGAVKAALTTPRDKSAGSPDLDHLVGQIQPHIDGMDRGLASSDPTLRKPVKANVDGVAERLVKRSAIVRSAVKSGRVKILPAIYALKTGKVEFWNLETLDSKHSEH